MLDVLTVVLSSAAISAALISAILWLSRAWISERLRNAIKFEYDRKLESHTAELSRISEDRTRKLERLLRHYERQVEEFYGPLWNMVHQLYVCNHTKSKLIEALDSSDAATVEQYYQQTYFTPLHEEIRQIIKTKLYLIEGTDMPASFYAYLKHALQERDQRELSIRYGLDTSFLSGVPWPRHFHDELKIGFSNAMARYEECLDGLKS